MDIYVNNIHRINSKPVIAIGVCISIAIFSLMLLLGMSLPWAIGRFTIIITLNVLLWFYFKNHLWRRPLLRKYLCNNRPDLNGRWEGTVNRFDKDGPHKFVLEITQTLTDLYVDAYSKNGKGPSITSEVVTDQTGNIFSIIYTWKCETKNVVGAHASGIFYGTSVLRCFDEKVPYLKGKYYTGRIPQQTNGQVEVYRVGSKLLGKL